MLLQPEKSQTWQVTTHIYVDEIYQIKLICHESYYITVLTYITLPSDTTCTIAGNTQYTWGSTILVLLTLNIFH